MKKEKRKQLCEKQSCDPGQQEIDLICAKDL